MGLFSNLFGSNGKDIDDAFKQMKNLAGDIIDDGQFNNSQNKPNPAPTAPAAPSYNASVQAFEEGQFMAPLSGLFQQGLYRRFPFLSDR